MYVRECAPFRPNSVLQDRDKSQAGKISYEQLEDIFRIYQVYSAGFFVFLLQFCTMYKVDLDDRAVSKITDDNGNISKEDFVKIAQDNKLLDFGNVMGGDGMKQGSAKKQSRTYNNNNVGQGLKGGKVFEYTHFLLENLFVFGF